MKLLLPNQSEYISQLCTDSLAGEYDLVVIDPEKESIPDAEGVFGVTDWSARWASYIADARGYHAPSASSVLACQHKLLARQNQSQAMPQFTPQFWTAHELIEGDGMDITWPLIVKPVVSNFSQYTTIVHSIKELSEYIYKHTEDVTIRNTDFYADIREHFLDVHIDAFIVEEFVEGEQFTLEGYIYNRECRWLGATDSVFVQNTLSFDRFEFPSALPADIVQRAQEGVQAFLRHIGYDNGFFNAEFIYDAGTNRLILVECNSRTALQFHWLYKQLLNVDVVLMLADIAVGVDPSIRQPGRINRTGAVAVCSVLRHEKNGVLENAHIKKNTGWLNSHMPESVLRIKIQEGEQLSTISQDTYSYRFGNLFFTATDREHMAQQLDAMKVNLRFDIREV